MPFHFSSALPLFSIIKYYKVDGQEKNNQQICISQEDDLNPRPEAVLNHLVRKENKAK